MPRQGIMLGSHMKDAVVMVSTLAACTTLAAPAISRLQEAYVLHAVDTVNDLGNVLYDISTEVHYEPI